MEVGILFGFSSPAPVFKRFYFYFEFFSKKNRKKSDILLFSAFFSAGDQQQHQDGSGHRRLLAHWIRVQSLQVPPQGCCYWQNLLPPGLGFRV
jgi:hypothetical protein